MVGCWNGKRDDGCDALGTWRVVPASWCARVVVLDHHKTALSSLDGAASEKLEIHLDVTRSGAIIARDYFEPEV